MELGPGMAVVENLAHQEADRPSDLVGILNQRFFIPEQNLRGLVIHQPLDKGRNNFGGKVVLAP